MVDIKPRLSMKTNVDGYEFEFLFDNNLDIKITTKALVDIHKHLIDVVKKQNEAQEEAKEKEEAAEEVVVEGSPSDNG